MPWSIIHQILGLAAVDEEFASEVLEHHLETIEKRGFFLTPEERDIFCRINSDNLATFSRQLLEYLEYSP